MHLWLSRARRSIGTMLAVGLVILATSASIAQPATGQVATNDQDQLWKQSIELVSRGDFAKAAEIVRDIKAGGELTTRVRGWLEEYEKQVAQRVELDRADFEKYAMYAKARIERDEYVMPPMVPGRGALTWALMAADVAEDRSAFLETDWVKSLAEGAAAEAKAQGEKGEWRGAWSIYARLGDLYDRNPVYRKLEHESVTHVRLDVMFDNKAWAERFENVRWIEAERALEYVYQGYVKTPDFRKMTMSGLEHLLLLADSKGAQKQFPRLADELDRGDFKDRVRTYLVRTRDRDFLSKKETADIFRRVVRDINPQTVDLPEGLLTAELMQGAFYSLDEYTTIIWPSGADQFQKRTRGDYIGVGIQIVKNPITDEVDVVTPLSGGPAFAAGVKAGDVITEIDGKSLKGLSLQKTVDTIMGPRGTEVTLTMRRDGEVFQLDLERREIRIESVKGIHRLEDDPEKWDYWLDKENRIGYIRVDNFQANTARDLFNVIRNLSSEGLGGMILDLRGNPGGLLNSAYEISSLFLEQGDNVVGTQGRDPRDKRLFSVRAGGAFPDLPLVVLVDENSASASEIVSGAIRDNERGIVMGARTFGKFSVQELKPLSRTSRSQLKMTTARYFLPSGASLHREPDSEVWGVEPNIGVRLTSKEKGNVYTMFREVEMLGPVPEPKIIEPTEGDEKAEGQEEKKEAEAEGEKEDELPRLEQPDENNRPKIDPQRDAALLYLRVQLFGKSHPTIMASTDKKKDGSGGF